MQRRITSSFFEFSNPNRTEPVLNVRLTTTINQYNLSFTFLGPLDKMQTSYVALPSTGNFTKGISGKTEACWSHSNCIRERGWNFH